MAGHAQLQFVMTECSKTQIRLTGLYCTYPITVCSFVFVHGRLPLLQYHRLVCMVVCRCSSIADSKDNCPTLISARERMAAAMSCVKRICVFEHSVMTNCNCACPAIQRGLGSGFLSEDSSWLTARTGDKYQIRLTRPKWFHFKSPRRNVLPDQRIEPATIWIPGIWLSYPARSHTTCLTQSCNIWLWKWSVALSRVHLIPPT